MDPSTTQLAGADKENAQYTEQSTTAPSTIKEETEKREGFVQDSNTSTDEKEQGVSALQDPGDRPTGPRLAFVLIALILSVFLFSLDQVSFHGCSLRADMSYYPQSGVLTTDLDNRGDCYS